MIVIGTARERRDLRKALERSPPDIIGEFDSLAEARRSGLAADAIVAAPRTPPEPDDDPAPETLTPREVQVLELVAEGLPNKVIAERLGISDQTVKFHIGSISGKLGAGNRTDAVRRAVRRGLIAL
ncbi:MAG TPA: LuxR C-terminal-related transcriptional regulator [Vicinamibacterales bacterium]|nr:LuxR C-terminal-related transcriptional regulator [Vicinamibacterales bacterium]